MSAYFIKTQDIIVIYFEFYHIMAKFLHEGDRIAQHGN